LAKEREWKYTKWTAQNHLLVSAKGFDWNDEKRYAAAILSTILWWNMSSRLFQNIREKQWLCYYINARHHSSPHDWVFLIRAWLEKERFGFWVEKIMQELEKIASGDITKEEFDKAMWFNIWQNQMWIESSDEMANFVWNQYLLYWRIKTLDDILEKIKKVKIEEVIDIAKYLWERNLYKYWIE
jgi:predicted Zn-dependent peptidase